MKVLALLLKLAWAVRGTTGLLALLLALAGGAAAQSPVPPWQTATDLGGNFILGATAADASGNVYLVGSYSGRITLGSTTLTTPASSTGFVAKWRVGTGWAWAMNTSAGGPVALQSVAVSGTAVYVTGIANGLASLGTLALAGVGDSIGFVARITDAGSSASAVWANAFYRVSRGHVAPTAVAVRNNAVYTAGSFAGSISIGGTTYASNGGGDAFVVALSDSGSGGSVRWVALAGSMAFDAAQALAVPPTGSDLYVSGIFQYTATFGSFSVSSAGGHDAFVTRLTDLGTTGRYDWVRPLGGPGNETAWTLATAGGAVYVGGDFNRTVLFGPTNFSAFGGPNGYVARIGTSTGTADGGLRLVPTGGGVLSLVAAGGHVYAAGHFDRLTTFGSVAHSPLGQGTGYVTRLRDTGAVPAVEWAMEVTGIGAHYVDFLALAGSQVVAVGAFDGPSATLAPLTLANNNSNFGTNFLATFTDPLLAAAPAASARMPGLWPNPAHGLVTVSLPTDFTNHPSALTLLDALGRPLRSQTTASAAAGTGVVFDVTGIAPGVYALRVQAGAYAATQKLVVE